MPPPQKKKIKGRPVLTWLLAWADRENFSKGGVYSYFSGEGGSEAYFRYFYFVYLSLIYPFIIIIYL